MKKLSFTKICVLLTSMFLVSAAHAAVPVGLWNVGQYNFVTKAFINSASACVKSDGSFTINTDWSGHWKKTGDLLLLRMNNTVNLEWSSAYSLTVTHAKLMTGHGVGWIGLNTTNDTYTTSVWTYKGVC